MNVKFIEAKEVKLQEMLSNAQEAYKVPIYQRPYAWGKDQWEDLFEDLKNLKSDDMHFFGSIVVVPEGEHRFGINYFQVVDGQQRLATVLIWLSAIRDVAQEKRNTELATYLTETFLFAKEWENGRQKKVPKLQLGELDNDAFQRVLEGKSKEGSHSIYECYKYFKNKTDKENMWQIILNNISIVHINAFNHFNAFRLFETLNDRGLELSAADLIKNFLLMKVSKDEEALNDVINQWNEMYDKVRDREPVKFIRRYFLANYKGKISESRLYEEVREKLEGEDTEKIRDFTRALNENATIYKKILECSFLSEKINKKLRELHLVEVAPSFTLLLKIMPCLTNDEISEKDILDIMDMIESFHIRWGVCGQSTSTLDQIYNDICMSLNNIKPQDFKATIKDILQKVISKNNVDDNTFKENFKARPFKPDETRTKYILWKLSKPTGETTINIKQIQTEHVMPQKLSNKWLNHLKEKTSKNEDEVKALHKENLNKIGNLTIIKGEWNISMSNRPFKEKQKDYKKSEFQITKELCNYADWTFEEIEKRAERLAEEACKTWKIAD